MPSVGRPLRLFRNEQQIKSLYLSGNLSIAYIKKLIKRRIKSNHIEQVHILLYALQDIEMNKLTQRYSV